jgi:DNA-binding NarL/FixJ family response regulator
MVGGMMTNPDADTLPSASAARSRGWALVVDDHPLFCEALEMTLRSVAPLWDVVTASTLQEGLDRLGARPDAPALVALDLHLPDVLGFDGLIRARQAARGAPVMVVSSMTDNKIVAGALRAGAAGYVPKHSPRATFKEALEAIEAGATYLPGTFVECATDPSPAGDDPIGRLATLTPQQGRILELICDGKLNKQIAFELAIAETTVKAHVTAIMRKLGVRSRTQAVLVARDARFAAQGGQG